MDKKENKTSFTDLSNEYKVISILATLAAKLKDVELVNRLYDNLKEISKEIEQFEKSNNPENENCLQTVDIYRKILSLKLSDMDIDNPDEKIKINEISIELNDKEEYPYLNIANALYEKGMFSEAAEVCKKITKMFESAPVWEILGKILRVQKKYDLSVEAYKKYLTLNEKDEEAERALYDIYEELLSTDYNSLDGDIEQNYLVAMTLLSQNFSPQALWKFAQLLKVDSNDIRYIKGASIAFIKLKAYSVVKKHFIPVLEEYKSDPEVLNIIGSVYFGIPENYKDAIPYYEKLVELYPNESEPYDRLSFLYERVYQDKFIDKQIFYAQKALEYSENKNPIYAFLAKLYYRNGDKKECEKYFNLLMNNNPKPEEKIIYGRYFMKEGNIEKGFDFYRCRFDTGNIAYPKDLIPEKRWNGEDDLSNSTVIVHYEQGFGDSVMFSRYIPDIAKLAKKVIFVVQKNLIPVFKDSGYERYCEILSHEADINPNIELENTNASVMYSKGSGMSKIPHDYHIPIADTPYLFKESPDKMYSAKGYLSVKPEKVEAFRQKYINKNDKIKVGLAYHGTKDSILTYRDIPVNAFIPLLKMDNLEFYSFQSDVYAKELETLDPKIKINDLGKVFKNFEDTACAMNCMDLVISSDNVVMNLAGALGVKTYGMFNVYTESRWYKTDGEDIGWYKSVKPFKAKTFNDWEGVVKEIKEEIIKEFC